MENVVEYIDIEKEPNRQPSEADLEMNSIHFLFDGTADYISVTVNLQELYKVLTPPHGLVYSRPKSGFYVIVHRKYRGLRLLTFVIRDRSMSFEIDDFREKASQVIG